MNNTANPLIDNIPCQPFLRWAGGKRWLVKSLDQFLPESGFNNYHEPFLGGGSIFFHLKPQTAFLSDLNSELIETYIEVRDNVEGVILELSKFKNLKDDYYKIRSSKFKKSEKRAARFIYLNQTSFNGIYRVNLNGQYNVPFGFRKKNFFEPDVLRYASQILKNAKIETGDFTSCLINVGKGDLVFLDPPYTISHNNNGFLKYNQKLFGIEDQYRLAELIEKINQKNAYYILTNAAHFKVKEIFEKDNQVVEVKRASLIGGTNAKRGKYSEYIFTNIFK